jgi:hypothetical protein
MVYKWYKGLTVLFFFSSGRGIGMGAGSLLNHQWERERERMKLWVRKKGTCTGVLIAARSMWPFWEYEALSTEGNRRARPSNVCTQWSLQASFLRSSCQVSTSFLSLYHRSTVCFASLTVTWEQRYKSSCLRQSNHFKLEECKSLIIVGSYSKIPSNPGQAPLEFSHMQWKS